MSDARSTIENLLNEMRTILLVAGVPKKQINMRCCAFKINTCNKAFDWLHELYMSPEYAAVVKVYKLLSPEIWTRYKVLGIEDLAEQVLLANAGKALWRRWRRQRPSMFSADRKTDNRIIANQPMDTCREG